MIGIISNGITFNIRYMSCLKINKIGIAIEREIMLHLREETHDNYAEFVSVIFLQLILNGIVLHLVSDVYVTFNNGSL
jgi:hypothetical protein